MATRTTYNDQTAEQLATQAAEAIRGLNHLTRDKGSLHTPAEVVRVLAALGEAVARLPQLLSQLDGLVERWTDEDLVAIDYGEFAGDPRAAVTTAAVYLTDPATSAAIRLNEALEHAQHALAFASLAGELEEEG
jgi:hypothetical protein